MNKFEIGFTIKKILGLDESKIKEDESLSFKFDYQEISQQTVIIFLKFQ
jgi:hypothetical protein